MKSPSDFINEELEKRSWTQDDLAQVLGRTKSRVNEIVLGKQSISVEVAADLASAFGTTAQVWLDREAAYRLSLMKDDGSLVRKRARLYELGPVKEMQRRGWIEATDNPAELEKKILQFYRISSTDEEPCIHGAMRKTNANTPASPAQKAWAFRVRQVAASVPKASLGKYDESRLPQCMSALRRLAAHSSEVRKVPGLLSEYGIRFVVVEGLSGAKMSGFATRLDDDSPVIGISLRLDRLDSFWQTLGHELIHVKYRDLSPVDGDFYGTDELPIDVKPPMERRADEEAAAMLINPADLNSFILRVQPFYSTERINQFANTIKMHPTLILGQLFHRGEISPARLTKNNIPIREAITKAAITDGWGKCFYSGVMNE